MKRIVLQWCRMSEMEFLYPSHSDCSRQCSFSYAICLASLHTYIYVCMYVPATVEREMVNWICVTISLRNYVRKSTGCNLLYILMFQLSDSLQHCRIIAEQLFKKIFRKLYADCFMLCFKSQYRLLICHLIHVWLNSLVKSYIYIDST